MGKQEKIRVSAGEDLLAFIPHIVGYWPENSVVCIGMGGKALRATMRLDLPPSGNVDLDGFARVAAVQLASDLQADGCLIALFAGEDWTEPDNFPLRDLHEALQRAFAAEGLPVRDSWYVGSGHWRSVECSNPSCCPWPGRSNSTITGSFVNAEFVFRGSAVEENPRERIPKMTAVTDRAFAGKVEALRPALADGLAGTALAVNQAAVTLGAWERSLSHWPEHPDAGMSAFLAASLGNTSMRDAVMVSLADTPELALAGLFDMGFLESATARPVVPPNWFGGNQAEDYEVLLSGGRQVGVGGLSDPLDLDACGAAATFSDILLGGSAVGGGAAHPRAARPNWGRMDRAEELLLFLAGSLQGPAKAPVLCLLGWIQWCRGRGTWAGTYFQASQGCQPGYKLAYLLERLLDTGFVAAWAKDQRTAWPGYRRDEFEEEAA